MGSDGDDLCLGEQFGAAITGDHGCGFGSFVETEAGLQEECHAGPSIEALRDRVLYALVNQGECVDAGGSMRDEEASSLIGGCPGQPLVGGDGMSPDRDVGKGSAAVAIEDLAGNGAHNLCRLGKGRNGDANHHQRGGTQKGQSGSQRARGHRTFLLISSEHMDCRPALLPVGP
jgi:hypothetical protein